MSGSTDKIVIIGVQIEELTIVTIHNYWYTPDPGLASSVLGWIFMTWRGAGHEYIRGQTAVWEWGHGGNDRHHTQLQHDINLVLLPSTCNYLDFAIGSKSKRERKSQVSTSSIFKSLDLARKYEPDSDRIWRKSMNRCWWWLLAGLLVRSLELQYSNLGN